MGPSPWARTQVACSHCPPTSTVVPRCSPRSLLSWLLTLLMISSLSGKPSSHRAIIDLGAELAIPSANVRRSTPVTLAVVTQLDTQQLVRPAMTCSLRGRFTQRVNLPCPDPRPFAVSVGDRWRPQFSARSDTDVARLGCKTVSMVRDCHCLLDVHSGRVTDERLRYK